MQPVMRLTGNDHAAYGIADTLTSPCPIHDTLLHRPPPPPPLPGKQTEGERGMQELPPEMTSARAGGAALGTLGRILSTLALMYGMDAPSNAAEALQGLAVAGGAAAAAGAAAGEGGGAAAAAAGDVAEAGGGFIPDPVAAATLAGPRCNMARVRDFRVAIQRRVRHEGRTKR